MKKAVLPSVATLLFSFGNGFLFFFAMNYAYREYKMPYPLSVIVVAFNSWRTLHFLWHAITCGLCF